MLVHILYVRTRYEYTWYFARKAFGLLSSAKCTYVLLYVQYVYIVVVVIEPKACLLIELSTVVALGTMKPNDVSLTSEVRVRYELRVPLSPAYSSSYEQGTWRQLDTLIILVQRSYHHTHQ